MMTDREIMDMRWDAMREGDEAVAAVCTLALGDTDDSTPDAEPGTDVAEVLDSYGLRYDALSIPVESMVSAAARIECIEIAEYRTRMGK